MGDEKTISYDMAVMVAKQLEEEAALQPIQRTAIRILIERNTKLEKALGDVHEFVGDRLAVLL